MPQGMCSVDGCGRSGRLRRGMCSRCYTLARRLERVYVRIFMDTYGPFPHPCHWCGESIPEYGGVFADAAIIHHRDHNHDNNDPANLAVGHRRCHGEHHGEFSDEHRAKLSAFQSAYQKLPEVRLRNSEAQKRVQKEVQNRPEVKAKVRAGVKRYHASDREPTLCPACGRVCVGRHGLGVHMGYMHRNWKAEAAA